MTPLESYRPWWQPNPFSYRQWQLWLVRAGFSFLVFDNIKWATKTYTTQAHPTGIANFVDLTWLADDPPGFATKAIVMAGLFLYTIGIAPALGLFPALFYSICIGTLVNSQGETQHSWQLVTLMCLGQFIVCLLPQRTPLGALRWQTRTLLAPQLERQQLVAYTATVVIAASYVVSGIVKLIASDFQWVIRVPYLAVQLLKNNWAGFYDTGISPPAWLEQATRLIIDHPNLARLFFGSGLVLELTAFIVLINRQLAFWFGLALVSLHVGIFYVMNLTFNQHIAAILIFLVMPNIGHALKRKNSLGAL
ncbi:hypothetical protein FEM03_10075 [Phragmitibacter flavus]|uniref:HTTM domain-containing protein n=1 Tax=Phragmitibacter flavus TaxID=2576071 RepID=A0A5R8KFA6_9BACT|nr:hypothetical protein [Phragmitibacter flavus]TLD70655.1 hypothetical protein FEM03_10075 [Phragmitibacter flavus]